MQCKIFILRPMSQGPFVTKKEKSHLGLGNGKPKLSSDDGGGSFLLSLVRKNGPSGGIVRTSMQGCQRAKPQNKQT